MGYVSLGPRLKPTPAWIAFSITRWIKGLGTKLGLCYRHGEKLQTLDVGRYRLMFSLAAETSSSLL